MVQITFQIVQAGPKMLAFISLNGNWLLQKSNQKSEKHPKVGNRPSVNREVRNENEIDKAKRHHK